MGYSPWGCIELGMTAPWTVVFQAPLSMGFSRQEHWMRWLDSITDSMDMNLSELQETLEDRGAWHTIVHGVPKSRTQVNNQTTRKGAIG